jgi:hypothetical protein
MLALELLLAGSFVHPQTAPRTRSSSRILLKASRILDIKAGHYLEEAGILIEGDRIKEVGRAAEVAAHATRDDPEASFQGQEQFTPWDDLDVAYFSGEALYTYCNTPFLCTYDGFSSEEIPPIQVDAKTWRRLKVTFPDTVKSHTKTQIFCFGPDGLLRRHDYTVDVLGSAPGLNYASDYRDVDGIIFPTKRRVYAYEGDYELVKEPLLVKIDMAEITLAYSPLAAV